MSAENTVGPAIAACDRCGDAPRHAVFFDERRNRKPRLGFNILNDHRSAARERIAGLRFATCRFMCDTHDAWFPTYACPQKKLGIARRKLQNLDELEVEHVRNHRRGIVKKFLKIN